MGTLLKKELQAYEKIKEKFMVIKESKAGIRKIKEQFMVIKENTANIRKLMMPRQPNDYVYV